jgi:hypothetical protein
MPLPSREQTFGFEDCRELLQKLDREIDRYREVVGRDAVDDGDALLKLVDQLKDSAFNASVTAWQLCDWVFNDMPEVLRQKFGFNKLGDLQSCARTKCRALHLCRQVATASKHWTVTNHPDPDVQVEVAHDGNGWEVHFIDQGQKIPADHVFELVYVFWDSFIREHGIAEALDRAANGLPLSSLR